MHLTLRDLAQYFEEQSELIDTADISDALPPIAAILVGDLQERFDSETAPDGTPWPPTMQNHPTLQHTGALLRSCLAAAQGASLDHRTVILDDARVEGYGWFHDAGTRTLPVRHFWGVSAQAENQMADVAAAVLVEKLFE